VSEEDRKTLTKLAVAGVVIFAVWFLVLNRATRL